MKHMITIDKTRCIHCGLCIKDCTKGCLEFDADKVPQFNGEGCMGCQHCMAICLQGAISFDDKNPDNSVPFTTGNSDELLKMIKSRRSVRFYKDENLSPEHIEKIKEMLAYPPTGGNVDCLHFSFVSTREKMAEIRALSDKLILNDNSGFPLYARLKDVAKTGKDIVYRGAPAMVTVSVDKSRAVAGCETVDPIIALSYLELYAHSLGLGTLWDDCAQFVANGFPEIRAMLQIPEGYTVSFVLLLGLPAVKYARGIQKDNHHFSIIS